MITIVKQCPSASYSFTFVHKYDDKVHLIRNNPYKILLRFCLLPITIAKVKIILVYKKVNTVLPSTIFLRGNKYMYTNRARFRSATVNKLHIPWYENILTILVLFSFPSVCSHLSSGRKSWHFSSSKSKFSSSLLLITVERLSNPIQINSSASVIRTYFMSSKSVVIWKERHYFDLYFVI